jgi:hypothetical protein
MSAGIEIYNYVSNQKGTPALYSDILANRPAAGFLGRLFISTDTLEIYRDTGTAWALISGGGGSVNIYNSDGTLTAARTVTMASHNLTFEGGAGTNRIRMSADAGQPRIFSFASANVARWAFRVDGAETGSNAGGDWALRAYNDAGTFTFSPIAANRKTGEKTLFAQANITAGTEAVTSVFNIAGITYASGLTMIGGNAHAAQFNNFTLANSGSLTFANSSFVGANGNVLRLQANNSGTITMQAATPGLRTAAVSLNQIQYNTTNGSAITYTHAANIQGLGILQLFAAGSLTVTNAYGLLLNDLNEYGYPSTGAGALSITNRWGIYQDSTTDANYLGGSVLIGTTTNAGFKTDINGTFRAVSTVTLSSLGGVGTRMVVADASGVLSTQAIPGGGGGITGSGTTNYVAKFTGASSIGNSLLFDDGTNVNVNGTAGTQRFNVNGNVDILGVSWLRYNVAGGYFGSGTVLSGLSTQLAIRSDSDILFGTNGANERVRFFVSGNVGIATTTDAGYRVDVNGTMRAFRNTAGASTVISQSQSGNVALFQVTNPDGTWNLETGRIAGAFTIFQSGASTRFTISSSGYVGINNTAPNTMLHAIGDGTVGPVAMFGGNRAGSLGMKVYNTDTANGSIISFGEDAGTTNTPFYIRRFGSTNATPNAVEIVQTAAAALTMSTNNTPRVIVTSTGEFLVGGTFNPFAGSNRGNITITGSSQQILAFTNGSTGTAYLFWAANDLSLTNATSGNLNFENGGSVRQRITNGGNILMGTTTDSGQRLQVAGTARIYGTALPHLLIEQTAVTGNVELQFSATDASYPAIIRSKAAQSIAFKDGTNSNLDIYSAGQLSIGGGGAPFGSTNTLTVLAGTAPTATASDCFTLYSKDITAGNAAPHFILENGAIVKIYQETTSVAAATFTANSGTAINDASTFDGYTLRQIVKALRNLGILQ